VIDYGQQSVENTFLKFNTDPSQTTLPSIKNQPAQPTFYKKLSSQYNGVYLYSYSQDTYDFQSLIKNMSMILGYLSILFIILGFIGPAGKLIVVEALAVIQITYFSILQFDKIPPTFIGFKNLILSNGYNDPDIFGQPNSQRNMNVYKLMGLNENILSNYNISFVILFILPFIIGFLGVIICKYLPTKKNFVKKELIQTDKINQIN
jgi:hypothetical protein